MLPTIQYQLPSSPVMRNSSHCPGPEYFQITQQRYALGIWTLSITLVSLYTTKFIIQQFLIFTLNVVADFNQISK